MEKKQTAVEFLAEEIKKHHPFWIDIIKKAKEMEKEQIAKAWDDGDYAYFCSKIDGKDFENGTEYYKELYGK